MFSEDVGAEYKATINISPLKTVLNFLLNVMERELISESYRATVL